jgi:centrosomal protein CEP78
MVHAKSSSSTEILSSKQKRSGFHGKYLTICKAKNIMPVAEVKGKSKSSQVLDFYADRIKVSDWIAICGALYYDKTLSYLAIRLRKNSDQGSLTVKIF